MSQFIGVMRHEFKMAVKRPGMWIAYAVLYVFYSITVFAPSEVGEALPATTREMWQHAAMIMFYANMFMVLLGGILAADRLQRDYRLGVRELQLGSPIRQFTYLLAKYFGVLAAVISPMFLFVMAYAGYYVVRGVPPLFLAIMPVVFLVMGGTAFAFVVAFSIACPLFMPVRVYQVLFVGYWFWGNYLSPEVFPTISGTLVVPSGKYALYGFFHGFPEFFSKFKQPTVAVTQAIWNLIILFTIIIIVLVVTTLILRRQTRRA
jgi:ABC-2 type transport system permease protein